MKDEKFINKYIYTVKEPSDAELKKFQKKWFQKKLKEEYHKKVDEAYKAGMKSLLVLVGELQSQNAELRHDITIIERKAIKTASNIQRRCDVFIATHSRYFDILNVGLFQELQLGTFYN